MENIVTTGQEVIPYTVGTLAVSNPIWLQWLEPGYQVLIMGLGLAVLVLTIRHKWLLIQKLKRDQDE